MNRCSEVMCTSDKPNPSSLDYSLWDYWIRYLFFSHTLTFLCDTRPLKLLTPWSVFLTHLCSCYFLPAFLHYLFIYFFHLFIYFLYAFIFCIYSFLCYFRFNIFCNVFSSSVLIFFQSTVHFISFCRF